MYTLVAKKSKAQDAVYDYVFKNFKSFYEIADLLSYSLFGRYAICIETDNVNETLEFIKQEKKYDSLNITIRMPERAVEYITLYNTKVNVQAAVKGIDIFKELVTKKRLLFDKGVIYTLYNSIPHDVDAMESVVETLAQETQEGEVITEKAISKLFLLNKIVYPRSVLLAFIYMDRWRWSKLEKCVSAVGADVALGAIVKNVKAFMEEKAKYYKTGTASKLIKSLNTNNLTLLYRILVTERCGVNDIEILLKMYERGQSIYDLLHEEES